VGKSKHIKRPNAETQTTTALDIDTNKGSEKEESEVEKRNV